MSGVGGGAGIIPVPLNRLDQLLVKPYISVVIPAYNEEKRLPPSLDRVACYLADELQRPAEVLIVNDGSKDRTVEVASKQAAELERDGLSIRVIENPGNRGKGYSVRNGMLEAQGEWVLFSDADLSAPIEELMKLLEAVQDAKADGEANRASGTMCFYEFF